MYSKYDTCIDICMPVSMYMYTYKNVVYIYIYVCLSVCICTHKIVMYIYVCLSICIYAHILKCKLAHICYQSFYQEVCLPANYVTLAMYRCVVQEIKVKYISIIYI